MTKSREVNKLKYLLKIKISRWRNFNTVASSHAVSLAKKKDSCIVISIRGGESFKFWNAYIEVLFVIQTFFSLTQALDMEQKCCRCEWVTKYKCLKYFTFVCNICTKVREDRENYSKEEKLVEKSENCDGN